MGSEPGVGWNLARHLAKSHEIWVITRKNNRPAIEAAMALDPDSHLHFIYYDLPRWARWWKRGKRGIRLYYYLWQIGVYFVIRDLLDDLEPHVIHHVTFVKYWTPCFVSFLSPAFLWGPVGGGESAPVDFRAGFGLYGRFYEMIRDVARFLAERDPFLRRTARRSAVALATTEDTAERLAFLGAGRIHVQGESGLDSDLVDRLEEMKKSNRARSGPIRFISIGRLLHWKGFHLGIQAFAESDLRDLEYWIVGDGPQRKHLETLTSDLGIEGRVRFWGNISRSETLRKLVRCNILVHPSLHDSGGWVCLEAMAAGLPIVCLDLGGPATQVTEYTGIKVAARSPSQVVTDLRAAMVNLASDSDLRSAMGREARRRIRKKYLWERKADQLSAHYIRITNADEKCRFS